MCTVVFGVLHIIVLVAAKCATNAVVQIWKMLSYPSKCVLICGRKYKVKGLHLISRVRTYPVLCQVK